MATKATTLKQTGDWGRDSDPISKPAAPATIEDRLAKLEENAQLTPSELTGMRALLDRAGFSRDTGTF